MESTYQYRLPHLLFLKIALLTTVIIIQRTSSTYVQSYDLSSHSSSGAGSFKGAPPIQYSTLSGPSFNSTISTQYSTVVEGSTAILDCAIKNLHNYTVSWVRSRDTRLLTTETITYTSDKRFVASNPRNGDQWILRIHYTKRADAGLYLCQVSTTPPIMLTVNLTVVEALLRILPGKEAHVQLGSRLELTCEVEGCRGTPILSWTREGYPVTNAKLLQTSQKLSPTPIVSLSLSHSHAVAAHSGTYTCSSSCISQLENVTVHVLKGEELAAMQHHNLSSQLKRSNFMIQLLATFTVVLPVKYFFAVNNENLSCIL